MTDLRTRRHFRFTAPPSGPATIEVDGRDIASHVTAIRIDASARNPWPVVELTLAPDAFSFVADAVVDVNSWAAGLLIDLGWAPPAHVDEEDQA